MALPPQRKGKLKFLIQDVYFMSRMSNVKRVWFQGWNLTFTSHRLHMTNTGPLFTHGELRHRQRASQVTLPTEDLDEGINYVPQLWFWESRDKHHTSTAVLYDSTIHDWMCRSFNAKSKRKPKNAQDHNNSFRTLEEMYRSFTNKGYGTPFKGRKMIRNCS